MTITPGFTGSPLDRIETARHDEEELTALIDDPRALRLILTDYVPTATDGVLGWAPLGDIARNELLLLGLIDGIPRFVHLDPKAAAARRTPELFALLGELPYSEAATYAAARSLLDWHSRHRFCANCGTMTNVFRAGWARLCPNCKTEHFPRTDPVVIMLAEHGEGADKKVLIGRQPGFPQGRFSALAGFVELGESFAEAVARELHEEAGVVATDVRYIASQPWPFPSQLMIACVAKVADDALTIDTAELEEAKWVTRADVAAAMAGDPSAPFLPPPHYAIAHTLFKAWLAENEDPPGTGRIYITPRRPVRSHSRRGARSSLR
ncbi:NAD(+) diphosphatase [Sphingomonas sp. MMS24-J13]|uniref:NAD(+) diphosphatase n=1 Tax=Sphingomonas sp. MMS24-J13 TaxID=3238686 RepID=UPI0038501158